MSKKKDQRISVSQAEEAQAQALLGQFHQISKELRSSVDREQAETALTPITSMSEAAQMALVNSLARERSTDAADVLNAINQLSSIKSIRKEARRSLIRLEQGRIYPQWEPALGPTIQPVAVSSTPSRFWKGIVTDSRDVGEVQLMLLWEQGDDYREVRVLGFLLEFWHEGVKDFFTAIESKRSIDKLLADMGSRVKTTACTLAKGRSLILEALAVNKKYGTTPHKDYRLHVSLVNQLVLEAPGIDEEEEDIDEEVDSSPIDPNLEPQQVVTMFVDAWVDGDYELAYNLLSIESSIREAMSQEEWVKPREQWTAEAQPARFKPNFLLEREPQKSGIWLPNPFSRDRSNANKVIDVGWSFELAAVPQNSSLPELPQATAVYKETGRHWFWTSYTLVQEEQGWRIQNIVDEGTNARALPLAELQRRIKENDKRIEDITRHHQPTDPDANKYFLEILWRSMQAIYYDDALLTQTPQEQAIYLDAAGRTVVLGEIERAIYYLERLIEQFPELRKENLQQIAALQMQLSEKYLEGEDEFEYDEDEEEEDEERSTHFKELAEAALREALTLQETALGHMLLAELLKEMDGDEKLDEAEEHLLQAQALTSETTELASIETSLGQIALDREEYEQALNHFQRVLEIDPTFQDVWYNIGQAQQMLGNDEEAKKSYRHAIEMDRNDIEAYTELADMYVRDEQVLEAREVLEEGLQTNPDSVRLLTLLSTTYLESDPRRAEELLEEAEEIDPDSEIVLLYRQMLNLAKAEQKRQPQARGKKPKKR